MISLYWAIPAIITTTFMLAAIVFEMMAPVPPWRLEPKERVARGMFLGVAVGVSGLSWIIWGLVR